MEENGDNFDSGISFNKDTMHFEFKKIYESI